MARGYSYLKNARYFMTSPENPRQLAFLALRDIYQRGAYSDIALERVLRQGNINKLDRNLVCELVYGTVRKQRALDAILDQFASKPLHKQPPDLRIILHLGLYQLRYLNQIPPSAAINTSVELAKNNKLKGLAGVVNGLLRTYNRQAASGDPLQLPTLPAARLGVLHSFPDFLIQMWIEELGVEATEKLCIWFNKPPTIDIRVNTLKICRDELRSILANQGLSVTPIPHLPQALRLTGTIGVVQNLPGFSEGWWMIQDSSAQLVSHLLDPQPGEIVIDACAAPGGKTTHIAELMQDQGKIWAGDRHLNRLKKVGENAQRLQLKSIELIEGDSRQVKFPTKADRVLIDAPCSGNGTLHKRPDLRWRQNPEKIQELSQLQRELLNIGATWLKPQGTLVYATCTLNPKENEQVIQSFLEDHPDWQIQPPDPNSLGAIFGSESGWLKIWPHEYQMDGFFMVKLKQEL